MPRHICSLDYQEARTYGAELTAGQLAPLSWGCVPQAWTELGRTRRLYLRLRWLLCERPRLWLLTWWRS